jgi:hypothetical protein
MLTADNSLLPFGLLFLSVALFLFSFVSLFWMVVVWIQFGLIAMRDRTLDNKIVKRTAKHTVLASLVTGLTFGLAQGLLSTPPIPLTGALLCTPITFLAITSIFGMILVIMHSRFASHR